MAVSSFFHKIYLTVFPEAWSCAVRFNKDSSVSVFNNLDDGFILLPNSSRYWTADPFLFKRNNKVYLFFEVFDRMKRKGLLGYREISQNNFGTIHIIFESNSHLSYPFIYEKDENVYIIPESNKSGKLYRLKCVEFPDKWEYDATITEDKLADTTLFPFDETDYYLSERVDETNNFERLDLFYDDNGKFIECKNNPVKLDANTARCAGKIFEYNGDYIRPSQDCGEAYGKKLNFNRITNISKSDYSEITIKTISHTDINLNCKNNFTGIHTYNKLDNVEVVDLKSKRRFNLLNFFGIFYKTFHRLLKRGQ